jgi:SHS2 domain-containing protein
MKFKFLPHTADIKFQAWGQTIEEAFENSALALFKALTDKKVKAVKKVAIRADGNDLEGLMYNFLEEFLFLLDSENFIGAKVDEIKLDKENFTILAKISGDSAKNKNYEISHIKAITYSDMEITHFGNRWVAQVVLDV